VEAIILAGGLGTRLRQVVPDLPKPMAPISGRPFLEILLHSLSARGFTKIVLSLGYKAEVITSYFGNKCAGIDLEYMIEDIPLGTGGASRVASQLCTEDHVYIFNGDTYLDLEIDLIERQWFQNKSPIIVGKSIQDTTRYGRLILEGQRVIGFTEKGISGPGLINAGCYVIARKALDHFPGNSPFSIETEYLQPIVKNSVVEVFRTNSIFIDIGVPEDYARAQELLTCL